MRKIEEQIIVKKAAAGNADAFEQLVIKYQSHIYNLCFRMTGNAEDAADLSQESFIKAWNNLSSFHFEAAFSTWLYRLTSNTCLDFLRSAKRHPQVSLTVEDGDGEEAVLDIPDAAATPEESVISAEDAQLLALAMEALDPEQRQILTLRVVNEMSYADIADILRIREGTVKSRLSRARDALRKKLLNLGNIPLSASSNHQKGGRSIELL